MKIKASEPGVIVSGVAHLALLAMTLVVFSDAKTFEPAQESVPVEILTDQQFNEITKGEKTAKTVKPAPTKADKVAEVEEKKPTPQVEAKVDVPTPPPPLKRIPDPGEDNTPEPPTPPKRVAAVPPPPPAPTPPVKPEIKPAPPKAEQKPEPPPKPQAEAVEPPKPPTRPQPPKEAPTPPVEARPKPSEKPLDKAALAKLLDDKRATDAPKPASRPKSGDETSEPRHRFDSNALAKQLASLEPPGQRPSTARSVNQTASIGAPTASAARMSPSMMGQLDSLMQDQYKQCWNYLGLGGETRYIPQIKVEYAVNGALVGQPALLNPPGDPNLRGLAESAMRAVRRCNPLRIPPQFAPYFEQWKARILRFDPAEMSG